MTGTPISPTDITVRPAAPASDAPASDAPTSDAPASDAPANDIVRARRDGLTSRSTTALPHPRETTEGRHRRGVTVAALIARAALAADATSAGSGRRAGHGGAHRLRRPSGRHRASAADETFDQMAHRRTLGGRPPRGVGRTALAIVLLVVIATSQSQILVHW